jgi:DNA-binding transcriptional regulator YbjK
VTRTDRVRRFLEARGAPQHVVEGGLTGLLRGWEATVASVAEGYPLDTLDDYLNDLDGRQILDEALAIAPRTEAERLRARVAAADARFRALIVPTVRCLWGDRAAAEHGWSADRSWWYWSRPQRTGAELSREIDGVLGEPDAGSR